jgi:3-deoxy-7-phosphoheptulonate synthase
MGADAIEDGLRPLLRAGDRRRPPRRVGVRPHARQHLHVAERRKTRHLDAVLAEIKGFFDAHRAEGTWPAASTSS